MTDTPIPLFIAILSAHKGLSMAISVADMAGRLGFERDKAGQRKAQLVKKIAVEQHGIPVGSSCGKSHGWFWASTPEEIESTVSQYEARIRSLARLIRKTKGAAAFREFVGQLQMEFERTT
jgi:hypothetical protein